MLPSCRNRSSIRTAIDTQLGSIPRRLTEIRTPWFAGTATSGVLVKVQFCGNAGSGGNGVSFPTQPTANNDAPVSPTPNERLKRFNSMEDRRRIRWAQAQDILW